MAGPHVYLSPGVAHRPCPPVFSWEICGEQPPLSMCFSGGSPPPQPPNPSPPRGRPLSMTTATEGPLICLDFNEIKSRAVAHWQKEQGGEGEGEAFLLAAIRHQTRRTLMQREAASASDTRPESNRRLPNIQTHQVSLGGGMLQPHDATVVNYHACTELCLQRRASLRLASPRKLSQGTESNLGKLIKERQ